MTDRTRLRKKEVAYVAGQLRSVKLDLVLERVIPAVELERHLHYYPNRTRLWRWWKETKKLASLIAFLVTTFSYLLKSFSTGKERYARFLAAWFQACGEIACSSLATERSRTIWRVMSDGYEYEVTAEDRSSLVHSVAAALFGTLTKEASFYYNCMSYNIE